MLWISTFQGMSKSTDSRFQVLASVVGELWGKVVVKVLEGHRNESYTDFFSAQWTTNLDNYSTLFTYYSFFTVTKEVF